MGGSFREIPPGLTELIALNRSLVSLVEPLRLLLEKGEHPDTMERILEIVQTIEAVGEQTRIAAKTMAQALMSQDQIGTRLEAMEKALALMAEDLRYFRREMDGPPS